MTKRAWLSIVAPFAVYAGYWLTWVAVPGDNPVRASIHRLFGDYSYEVIVETSYILIIIAVVAWLRGGLSASFDDLGLSKSPVQPFLFVFVATLPALIGFYVTGQMSRGYSGREFVVHCITNPFFEELMFRGLLFGQLQRRAGWNFWPSAILPAILFASEHLHQEHSLAGIGGVLAVTALGALIFSYFFKRFGWNLWVAYFLHALLNTYWTIFTTANTALGGVYENIFRFGSIALAFALVAAAARFSGLRLLVPAAPKPALA